MLLLIISTHGVNELLFSMYFLYSNIYLASDNLTLLAPAKLAVHVLWAQYSILPCRSGCYGVKDFSLSLSLFVL
jgi:hypothetical protein